MRLLRRRGSNTSEKAEASSGSAFRASVRKSSVPLPTQNSGQSLASPNASPELDLRFSVIDLQPRDDDRFPPSMAQAPRADQQQRQTHQPLNNGGAQGSGWTQSSVKQSPQQPPSSWSASADAYQSFPQQKFPQSSSSGRLQPREEANAFYSSAALYATAEPSQPPQQTSRQPETSPNFDLLNLVNSANDAMQRLEAPSPASRNVSVEQSGSRNSPAPPPAFAQDQRFRGAPAPLDQPPLYHDSAAAYSETRLDAPRLNKKGSNSAVSDTGSNASVPSKLRPGNRSATDLRTMKSPPPAFDARALSGGWKMQSAHASSDSLPAPPPRRNMSSDDRIQPPPSMIGLQNLNVRRASETSGNARPPQPFGTPQQNVRSASPAMTETSMRSRATQETGKVSTHSERKDSTGPGAPRAKTPTNERPADSPRIEAGAIKPPRRQQSGDPSTANSSRTPSEHSHGAKAPTRPPNESIPPTPLPPRSSERPVTKPQPPPPAHAPSPPPAQPVAEAQTPATAPAPPAHAPPPLPAPPLAEAQAPATAPPPPSHAPPPPPAQKLAAETQAPSRAAPPPPPVHAPPPPPMQPFAATPPTAPRQIQAEAQTPAATPPTAPRQLQAEAQPPAATPPTAPRQIQAEAQPPVPMRAQAASHSPAPTQYQLPIAKPPQQTPPQQSTPKATPPVSNNVPLTQEPAVKPVPPPQISGKPREHASTGSNGQATTMSSSDGSSTTASSGVAARRSQDSITTPDYDWSDVEAKIAAEAPAQERERARPGREAEKLERARSRRISKPTEADLVKRDSQNEGAPQFQHKTTDSKSSTQSRSPGTAPPRPLPQPGRSASKDVPPTPARSASKDAPPVSARPLAKPRDSLPPPKREPEPPRVPNVEILQRETRQILAAKLAAHKRPGDGSGLLKRARDRTAEEPERRPRPDMVVEAEGWKCRGVGDIETWEQERKHWRKVRETRKFKRQKQPNALDFGSPEEEEFEGKFDVYYNDLFELIWSVTTPDVTERMLFALDVADVRSLRQTSRSLRWAIGTHQEVVVARMLEPIGYKPYSDEMLKSSLMRMRYFGATQKAVFNGTIQAGVDPCAISLDELEAFLLSGDLQEEYALVARDYMANPETMDRAIPQLARASTRAYSRVLARLRQQPGYKVPKSAAEIRTPRSSAGNSSVVGTSTSSQSIEALARGRDSGKVSPVHSRAASRAASVALPPAPSSSPAMSVSGAPLLPDIFQINNKSFVPKATAPTLSVLSPQVAGAGAVGGEPVPASNIKSPYKPGRAPVFRVWVPPRDSTGWLSDSEIAACEEELLKAGVWHFMRKGDVVWDIAVGEHMNEGKFIFDGSFLRDLSYAYDIVGHLPSWLNVVVYSPSYWHNVIVASSPQPVVHLDISPWREQILANLKLVQDQVETMRPNGSRFRLTKWMYRSAATINSGQIISKMNRNLEVVDEGWKGRIVVEMEGTAESAKLLVERCAGADATMRDKRTMLANVMGDLQAASKMLSIQGDFDDGTGAGKTPGEPQTWPYAVLRERSRPGLIWLRPITTRERLVA